MSKTITLTLALRVGNSSLPIVIGMGRLGGATLFLNKLQVFLRISIGNTNEIHAIRELVRF